MLNSPSLVGESEGFKSQETFEAGLVLRPHCLGMRVMILLFEVTKET